jgi:hypothetical protein
MFAPEEASMIEPAQRRVATIVHAALTLGVITFGVIAIVLLPSTGAPLASDAAQLFRVVAIVLAGGGLMAVNVLRQRIRPPGPQAGAAEWTAAFGRAIVVWGVAEGVALVGTVFWLVVHDAVVLLPVGVGLVLLVWTRPSVLLEQ